MIVLLEIAEKLQEILNANPNSDFDYVVYTPGLHLDKISNSVKKKNFIPVFISSMGGTNNPVPELKQAEATIPVTFYFPVRFKETMFLINDYLNGQLVGKTINWGTLSGSILSNLSLPRYGEIQDLDLIQFKEWTQAQFHREIEIMEPYITMELSIYLSAVDSKFIFGNNVKLKKITIYQKNPGLNVTLKIFEDDNPISIDRVDIGSSEPAAQQTFSTTYSKGFPANASYTKQIPLLVKNNLSYYNLMNACEGTKTLQNLLLKLEEEIPVYHEVSEVIDGETVITQEPLVTSHFYYITNYSRRTSLGQLLGISLTLADSMETYEEIPEK